MNYCIGNGFVVINDIGRTGRENPHLWTVALADNPPVFWFWENIAGNHIWERIAIEDVPTQILNIYSQVKDEHITKEMRSAILRLILDRSVEGDDATPR
jgi:hypothetical protein